MMMTWFLKDQKKTDTISFMKPCLLINQLFSVFFYFLHRQSIGVRFFYISAILYMFYLANLTMYMLCVQKQSLLQSHAEGDHEQTASFREVIYLLGKLCS